jgi:hypothetical protein
MLIELADEASLDAVLPDEVVVVTAGVVVVSVGVSVLGLVVVDGEFEFEDEFELEFEDEIEFEFEEKLEEFEAEFDEVEGRTLVEVVGVKSGRMIGAVGVVGVTSVVVGVEGVGVVGVTVGGGAATVSSAPLIVTVSTAVSVRVPFETV